jgi:hypothetical protein
MDREDKPSFYYYYSPLTNANQLEVPDATEGVTTSIRV